MHYLWRREHPVQPWIVAAVMTFGVLAYTVNDLLYLALAREGVGYVTQSYDLPSRGRRTRVLEFDFEEPDGFRREGQAKGSEGSLNWPVGAEIQIQYLPRWFPAGPDGARPARPLNWLVLGLLILSAAGFAIFAWRAIVAGGGDDPQVIR
ncbi:MAG: hypothetical protein SFU86_17765 [Pirellulaceae bacterium]|nr:hypothetical protein [Pirellulaceae bacterium]